ncbi:MAG: HAMP domain-containing histidine kinase [Lachnospiraceae bacterium]|nr:HAMP domain-containing histidine kinase [Lachnospiraceae bacterium]
MNKIMRSFAGKFFLFATSIATLVFAEEKIFSKYLYDWFTMVTRIRLSINVSEIQNIQLYIVIVAGIAAWVWLIVVAAKRPKTEDVIPGITNYIPTDVMLLAEVSAAVGFLLLSYEVFDRWMNDDELMLTLCLFYTAFCVLVSVDFAGRVKSRSFFKNTVCWMVIKFFIKVCRLIVKGLKAIPFIWRAVLLVGVVTFTDLVMIALCIDGDAPDVYAVFWTLGHLILVPAFLYASWNFRSIKLAAERMAKGDLSKGVDTRYMIWGLKEHGKSLNALMTGMNAAVSEKLKSERMKTDLITNVSHDIKTPLTSIINYADLINTETNAENVDTAKLSEYSEVIYRQSGKLKRLLDDLMEVSKASSGNIETNLEECEADILLSQAVGEFEDRFNDCGLTAIMNLPDEPVRVMADRQLLWRVFDNLLNNICKYALPGSRVFFGVTENGKDVFISFKNTSRELLNVSAEELKERFVRGDSSRNSEIGGHGLGLAIAENLTQLQGGELKLSIDADLFTAVLQFKKINHPA